MTARAHGWDIGGRVDASPAPGEGFDRITFGLDGGTRDVLPHIGVADAVELEGGRILLTLWSPLRDELEPVARYTYEPGSGWLEGIHAALDPTAPAPVHVPGDPDGIVLR